MMKKFLSIVCLMTMMFVAGGLKAQTETLVISENFNNFTNGSMSSPGAVITSNDTLDAKTQQPGWTSYYLYPAGGMIKLGTSSAAGNVRTPAIDLSGDGGNFVVRFKAMAWYHDSTTVKIIVDSSRTFYVNGLRNDVQTDSLNPSYMTEFTFYCTGGTDHSTVRIKGASNSGHSRFFLDDISISTFSGEVITFNPSVLTFDRVLENSTVNGTIYVKGYNLSNASYAVTLTGTGFSTTVTSIAKADLLAGYNIPVTFSPTTIGDYNGTLVVNGTQATLVGHCVGIVDVPTLAELKTKMDYCGNYVQEEDDQIYRYTGEATVTSAGVNTYNYHYITIQDETDAIVVFDKTGAFISNFSRGQSLTNLQGTLTNYFGCLEMVPVLAEPELINPFADDVEPQVVTYEQMADNDYMCALQSRLVVIENSQITSTGTFEAGKKYVLSNGVETDTLLYTLYADANYIGSAIPSVTADIKGIAYILSTKIASNPNQYIYRYHIIPRDLDDLVAINEVELEQNIDVYPNPVTNALYFNGANVNSVEIYDMLGNKVAVQQNVGNSISLNDLTAGMYMVKFITDEGVAIKKIVKE